MKAGMDGALSEPLLQPRNIRPNSRLKHRIDDCCRGTGIFPVFRTDVGRQDDWHVRQRVSENLTDTSLMCWIFVGMEKRDCDRLNAIITELSCNLADCLFVQGDKNYTVTIDSLRHALTEIAG